MKKSVLTICMLLGFTVATAFGGTSGGQQPQHPGDMPAAQQSPNMKNGQMTNNEMIRSMAAMMKQMNETMQRMTSTIENKNSMEPRTMVAMGKMTHEMAEQMNELAVHMEQGAIDQQTVSKMQDRMKSMGQKIDAIQKEDK